MNNLQLKFLGKERDVSRVSLIFVPAINFRNGEQQGVIDDFGLHLKRSHNSMMSSQLENKMLMKRRRRFIWRINKESSRDAIIPVKCEAQRVLKLETRLVLDRENFRRFLSKHFRPSQPRPPGQVETATPTQIPFIDRRSSFVVIDETAL